MLCCVDKQGILSWPNPSPETVLFFSGKVEPPHSSHEDLTDELSTRSFCHLETDEEVRGKPLGSDVILYEDSLNFPPITTLSKARKS